MFAAAKIVYFKPVLAEISKSGKSYFIQSISDKKTTPENRSGL